MTNVTAAKAFREMKSILHLRSMVTLADAGAEMLLLEA